MVSGTPRTSFGNKTGFDVSHWIIKFMTRFKRLTLLGAVAVLAGSTGLLPGNRLYAQDAATVTQPAPAWKLKDLDGHAISSDRFKGKVVVVDFWATWCAPCVSEIPGYIELQRKYGPDGLVIVGISMDQNGPDQVKKFAKAKGMNYTIVMGDENVAEAFGGIEGIPTTFLINRQGRIVNRKVGAMPHDEYEKLVKQALN